MGKSRSKVHSDSDFFFFLFLLGRGEGREFLHCVLVNWIGFGFDNCF